MIVSLAELKAVLGIPLDDASQDDYLTRLILAKTAWVEGYTQRRFDTPIAHTQIEQGIGEAELYLEWHLADPDSLTIYRRPILERFREWELLVEGEDWEINEADDDIIFFLRAWQVWPLEDEMKLTYQGGYDEPPEDIKEVILSMASNQYLFEADSASETAGLTSEKIGDYNYSLGSSSSTSTGAIGSDVVGDTAMMTLNRYKRRFV